MASANAAPEEVKALFGYPCKSFIVRAALEGHMGFVRVTGRTQDNSLAARITVGVLTYLAGTPTAALLERVTSPIVVPLRPDWEPLIEAHLPALAPYTRHPMTAALSSFDVAQLQRYVDGLHSEYTMMPITAALAAQTLAMDWSSDLCGNFADPADFASRGLGFVALHAETGEIAAGAASFAVCDTGIEVEVDTAEAHQRRGLALACSARLIIECVRRGLYPNWDAHVPHSAHLAEKLGYKRGTPYTAYTNELPA